MSFSQPQTEMWFWNPNSPRYSPTSEPENSYYVTFNSGWIQSPTFSFCWINPKSETEMRTISLSLPGHDILDINQNHFWESVPKYLGINHSIASMNMHALGKAKYSWKHKTVLPLNKNTLFIPDRLSKHTLNQVKTVLWNSWLGHIWRIFG